MKYLKHFEDIKIPIKVGDTVLGGRFKNKKIVVKKIGKNKKGDITINDKPLLKFRIIKESLSDDAQQYLTHLEDDGFSINIGEDYIRIFKPKYGDFYAATNLIEFSYDEIAGDISRFVSYVGDEFNGDEFTDVSYTISSINYITKKDNPTKVGHLLSELDRNQISFEKAIDSNIDFKLLALTIMIK